MRSPLVSHHEWMTTEVPRSRLRRQWRALFQQFDVVHDRIIRRGPLCAKAHFSLSERCSHFSNVPRRYSSIVSASVSVDCVNVRSSVNAAFGYACQIARSSGVTVSQPNLNMYRPGSVTRPTCAQVILLTAKHFPFAFSPSSTSWPPACRNAQILSTDPYVIVFIIRGALHYVEIRAGDQSA
jgi:hypothetical protein